MPVFMIQASYTPEAMAKLIANPQDRFDSVRSSVERLGGRILNMYFAFGEHDVILITEMPENVSAAALSLAATAGGSLRTCRTTPLMSNAEGMEAMRKAATVGYKPVQAAASAAAAPTPPR
ncbi:MAG TPA: GYD domain-containing protein [Candidatus Acidoferrum sp.]|nr:GYD domain-containing protein [Candidatus Acidoferrum sp.]